MAINKQCLRKNEFVKSDGEAYDVLCYADQGAFQLLRALGRGQVIHCTLVYPHVIDESAVKLFNERLVRGLLGRLLQRSPLPWGRHRWVTCPVPAPVTWFRDPIAIEDLPEWRSALVTLPVDPEHGPGWRLAVQLLEGGGCALSILIAHTIADGLAVMQAMVDACAGRSLEPGFPEPARRWMLSRLIRDSRESLRALPDVWQALKFLVRRLNNQGLVLSGPGQSSEKINPKTSEPRVDLPLAQAVIDAKACEERAAELGVALNTLLAVIAVRLAFRIGRVDSTGRVELVLPVSDRQPGDRRGNALRAATVMVDPDLCFKSPGFLQREIMAALISLRRHGDDWSPLFPLIPFMPKWLARRLERQVFGRHFPVGCSLIGELPSELNNIFGEISLLQLSGLEHYTASLLERMGGGMLLVGYRMGEKVCFTVNGYAPNRITTRAEFLPHVHKTLDDIGLHGEVY